MYKWNILQTARPVGPVGFVKQLWSPMIYKSSILWQVRQHSSPGRALEEVDLHQQNESSASLPLVLEDFWGCITCFQGNQWFRNCETCSEFLTCKFIWGPTWVSQTRSTPILGGRWLQFKGKPTACRAWNLQTSGYNQASYNAGVLGCHQLIQTFIGQGPRTPQLC